MPDIPLESAAYEGQVRVGRVLFDSMGGLGNVPDNTNVAYKGFVVWMKPQDFLRLNPPRPARQAAGAMAATRQAIEEGQGIGPPFLDVELVTEGADAGSFRVRNHEGRGRMMAINEIAPDTPVPVHMFGHGAIDRGRDITPEMLEGLVDPESPVRILADRRVASGGEVKPDAAWHVPVGEDYRPNDLPTGRVYRSPNYRPPLQQVLQEIVDAPESSFAHPRQRAQKLIHTIVESDEFFRNAEDIEFGRESVIRFESPSSLQEQLREFGVQIPETLSEDVLSPYLRSHPSYQRTGDWRTQVPQGPTNWGYAEEAIPRVIERIRREGGPNAGDKLEALDIFYREAVIDYGQASPENDRWLRERISDYDDPYNRSIPSVDPSTRESNPYHRQHRRLQEGGLSQEELIDVRQQLPLEQGGYLTQEGDAAIDRKGRPQPVGMPQHRESRLAATRRSKDMQTLWNNSVEPEFVRSNRYIHWSTLEGASDLLAEAPDGRYLGGEISARVFPKGATIPRNPTMSLGHRGVGFLLEGDVSYIGQGNLWTFPAYEGLDLGLPRQGRRYVSRAVSTSHPFAMSADQLTGSSEAVLREPRIVGIVSNPPAGGMHWDNELRELSEQLGGRVPVLEIVPDDPNLFRPIPEMYGVPQPENVEQIIASVSQGGRSRVGAVTEVADVAGQYPMFPPEEFPDALERPRRLERQGYAVEGFTNRPTPESPPTRQGPHPAQQELFSPGEIGGAQGPEDLQARGSTMVPRSDDLPPPPPVGERSPPGSLTAARNAAAARATEEANRARMLRNAGIRSGLETLGTAAEIAALGYNTVQEGDPLRGLARTGAETIEGVGSIFRAPAAGAEMLTGHDRTLGTPLGNLSAVGDAITRVASPYRSWQEREARIRENTPDRVTQQREARNEAVRRALAPKE